MTLRPEEIVPTGTHWFSVDGAASLPVRPRRPTMEGLWGRALCFSEASGGAFVRGSLEDSRVARGCSRVEGEEEADEVTSLAIVP